MGPQTGETSGIVPRRCGVVYVELAGWDRLNIRVEASVLTFEGRLLGLGAPWLALLHVLQIDDAVLYAAVRTEDHLGLFAELSAYLLILRGKNGPGRYPPVVDDLAPDRPAIGDFGFLVDLCRGGHAGNSQDRKSTRLTPVTNAQLVCRLL